MPKTSLCTVLVFAACAFASAAAQKSKAPISLDEYFNTTQVVVDRISPDGTAAVIATEAPDWKNNTFRHDLWLWTAAKGLRPLTHSGSEENPQWSPDGKWIAFISDRALAGESANEDGTPAVDSDRASRLWIISVAGGEALPLYPEKLDVHAFAWSRDSRSIYYSVMEPLTQQLKDAQKAEWKDVIRWRDQQRGDVLLKQTLAKSLEAAVAVPMPVTKKDAKGAEDEVPLPKSAQVVAHSSYDIAQIAPSPDGSQIAFETDSVHHRMETPKAYEMYLVPAAGGVVKQLTHNQAIESGLRWSRDGKWMYFQVSAAAGSLEGAYRDVQGRLYRMQMATGKIDRLGSSFDGSFDQFTLLADGREIALGLKGTETQLYLIDADQAIKLPGLAGSYAGMNAARDANALLLTYSTITQPTQVYLAKDPLHPERLTALTDFNQLFSERAQPQWQSYTWKSDDGQTVEGVLIYPPGKKGQKHLRMLTLIHGGPADADGNRWGADWYDWATLAAAKGWLVFRPNYRGSSGYGDKFMLDIAPHLVSKPGRDILTGVDALVKEGYADPDHLAIGGYSYGGYMTNWLITQTTRFRSAITGAGAVEHAANWGNDDETWDDAWYLGGQPWDDPGLYQSEAALFQFNKVKTPTHLVQGGADIRVSYLEGVTMERALEELGIPHEFLVFPGEGHGLGKNPWHGYIKVRDELKWLEKYDGK